MSSAPMSHKMRKPGARPNSLGFEIDYNSDPEYHRDPHARAADMARNAPSILWTPFNGGHWMFQSHEAVIETVRDFEHSPEAFNTLMATPNAMCDKKPLPLTLKFHGVIGDEAMSAKVNVGSFPFTAVKV